MTIMTPFNDRELATVLHALRMLQEFRARTRPPEAACGCTHEEYTRQRSSEEIAWASNSCDHFEGIKPLDNEEIDSLCESLGLAPADAPPDPAEPLILYAYAYSSKILPTDWILSNDGISSVRSIAESEMKKSAAQFPNLPHCLVKIIRADEPARDFDGRILFEGVSRG